MAVSDALVVGEDWISEHYFTTDAKAESFAARVRERRQAWDAEAKPTDGTAPVATTRSRFLAERGRLESLLAELPGEDEAPSAAALAAADELDAVLRQVLGFVPGELVLTESGPVTFVSPIGTEGAAPTALLHARPAATIESLLAKDGATLASAWTPVDLAEPAAGPLEGAEPLESVSRTLSALFTDDSAPAFALVLAGRWALVAEKERWPEGRWLGVDLQLVVERNDTTRAGELDRALTCLDAESLVPGPEGTTWWAATLEDSAAHTAGVSKDLREGVRESIEVIANEVVARRRAQGLDALLQEQAQPLALQSLRFIYRIIFLLYAEASPELGVLPAGAEEYDAGYGLDRLRELALVELHEESSLSGTHVYESLGRLFDLVNRGHRADVAVSEEESYDGLVFRPLAADLFQPAATALIDEVGLGNGALLKVLSRLLLTRENTRGERGFISYVELGINQLGAVYEGLMSYTGSFATEPMWEVAPNGDASKGSWVVPRDVADGLEEKDFVTRVDEVTGEKRNVTYEAGAFVFRLSGRDRQRSASFYTPEVLTRFTVQQALEELLDQDGHVTTAEEVLHLTVCEPALGSGAFAIEAVRQLAEEHLSRRERETGKRVDPDERPRELAKVKAYIALHQVYGVDLNATAVELAEISLWLDTMVEGLGAPWFGLRLRRGNSLIGAKRALYPSSALKKRAWLTQTPVSEPLTQVAEAIDGADATASHRLGGALDVSGRVHHFLLPAQGWGSATEVPKQVRDLVEPDRLKALKAWRKAITKAPAPAQIKRLEALSRRAEVLWELTLRRLRVAELGSSRAIDLWERAETPGTSASVSVDGVTTGVSRAEIERYLDDPDSAYRRLHLVMDAWCALWFWPLTTAVSPPSLSDWLDTCEAILGTAGKVEKDQTATFTEATAWEELGHAEKMDLAFAGARKVADVLSGEGAEWLGVVQDVVREQGFFHWELDFATVFARGGFDLQVGNPPWVRPDVNLDELLADSDPWWALSTKPSITARRERLSLTLARPHAPETAVDGATSTQVLGEFVSDPTVYPSMEGRPDLYRAFMCAVWDHLAPDGTVGLIHMDTHLTDAKTPNFRAVTYRHLRRHWQFINELNLFEIQHQKDYSVNVYSTARAPLFQTASSLYHPGTASRSLHHDNTGEEPGFKDPTTGTWDLRPHRARIQTVNSATLKAWAAITATDAWQTAPTVSTVNSAAARTLDTLASSGRVSTLNLNFSTGWNETTDFEKGRFVKHWGKASWDDVILQGPHLFASTPFYKMPNATMTNFRDWTTVDIENIPVDSTPITQYKPSGNRTDYDASYSQWGGVSARNFYRIAWRNMAPLTGERTLVPAIIPRHAAHLQSMTSASPSDGDMNALISTQASAASLLADFLIRSLGRSHINGTDFAILPHCTTTEGLTDRIALRTLRLNCLTDAYADLWSQCWDPAFTNDAPILERYDERPVGPEWTADTPLRRAEDRRNAQVEIDVMVAIALGVPIEDLCTIYRTQFAVLYDYDHGRGQGAYVYDANGRQVPTPVRQAWVKAGKPTDPDAMPIKERSHRHPGSGVEYVYELPFRIRDREADFRHVHAALTGGDTGTAISATTSEA